MNFINPAPSVIPSTTTLRLSSALDYSLAGDLGQSILALSSIIAIGLCFLRWRTLKLESSWDAIGDLCTTVILVAALTLGTLRWLEFNIVGSVVAGDFTQDYVAAQALRHKVSIYGAPLKTFTTNLLHFDIMKVQPEVLNFHPPFDALLFLPFSYFPHAWAFISWNAIGTLAYLALIYILLNAYGLVNFRTMQLSSILLIWEPFVGNIALGQISTILALLIIGGFLLLERKSLQVAAGLMFGLATLVKLFPGLIVVYLLFRRHWRCAGIMVATISAGFVLTLIIIGSPDIIYYLRNILPEQVRAYGPYPFNISVESVVRTLFATSRFSAPIVSVPQAVQSVTLLFNGCLLLRLFLLSKRYRGPENGENLFVLFCVTMLLISPITWPHTCLIILLPMAILLGEGFRLGQKYAWRVLFALLILFAIPNRVVVNEAILLYPRTPVPWYVMLEVKFGFFALLILWVTFHQRLALGLPQSSLR